jgi:FkbM family methyltransferase
MAISERKSARLRRRFLLSLSSGRPPLTIVDVGANPIAQAPYADLLADGGCRVVGFEPQAEAFERLQASRSAHETYVRAAVGKPGPARLRVYPSSGFTSLYPLHAPSLAYLGRFGRNLGRERIEEVELRALDEIDEVDRIDLLKMDVQGAERDILESGRKKLAQAVAVIPEMRFHRLYAGEPLMGELDQALRAQGFVLHKFLPLKQVPLPSSQAGRFRRGPMQSQLVDGDAVYIRSLEAPEGWSDDQLGHLALAADSVFGSPDLTLMCLDLLAARGAVPRGAPRRYADRLPDAWRRAEAAAEAAE